MREEEGINAWLTKVEYVHVCDDQHIDQEDIFSTGMLGTERRQSRNREENPQEKCVKN